MNKLKISYIRESEMATHGKWATENEIFAAATLLNTDIYVFGPTSRDKADNSVYKWLCYKSEADTLRSTNKLRKSRESMYICNLSDHFTPVYDI